MQIRKYIGLAAFTLVFSAFCPPLSAASYTWSFTGNAGTNCGSHGCANPGNSMTFQGTASGAPTISVTVTAWYASNSGPLKSATLGQYSSGLGDCYTSENCSGANQQVDDNGNNEFLLFQFSAPFDPTSIKIKSPANSGMGVSYWLGSTTNPSINLTNMNMTTSLSTLGFGSQTQVTAPGTGNTRTIDFNGPPSASVNAVLFGAMYGFTSDGFDIMSMSGSPLAASVPEPASIFFLFTVIVAGLKISRGRRVVGRERKLLSGLH